MPELMYAAIHGQPPKTVLGQWLVFVLIDYHLIQAALFLSFIVPSHEMASCNPHGQCDLLCFQCICSLQCFETTDKAFRDR